MSDLIEELYQYANEVLDSSQEWRGQMARHLQAERSLCLLLTPEAETCFEAWNERRMETESLERRLLFQRGLALGIELGRLS